VTMPQPECCIILKTSFTKSLSPLNWVLFEISGHRQNAHKLFARLASSPIPSTVLVHMVFVVAFWISDLPPELLIKLCFQL
jgi:hypothetical protein